MCFCYHQNVLENLIRIGYKVIYNKVNGQVFNLHLHN